MKYGVRKPNIKKSVKARTTGKMKRQVKKAVNPLYGKKGMGVINNPKKAAYNAVYNRTTVGVSDLAKSSTPAGVHRPAAAPSLSSKSSGTAGTLLIVLGVALALLGLLLLLAVPIGGVIAVAFGVVCVIIGRKYRKNKKDHPESDV